MTEEEAKTKWCPFARIAKATDSDTVAHGQPVFNRLERSNGATGTVRAGNCIASACMAWRTRREDHYYNAHGGLEEGPRVVGFCGLAGQP